MGERGRAGIPPTAGSGLTLNLSTGTAQLLGNNRHLLGRHSHHDRERTNYVYLDPGSSCAPASNTTGFTSSLIPIAKVVAGSSSITSIADDRTMQTAPGSGGGTTTHALTLAASGGASPRTFDGSAAVTGYYHTLGAAGC